MTTQHTITTLKGSYTGTIEEVCAWQAEQQGAGADIDGVDVDGVEFDAEDLDAAIGEVRVMLAVVAAGLPEVGERVEAGNTIADYDTGRVRSYRIARDGGLVAQVTWDSGTTTMAPAEGLRGEGEDAPPTRDQIEELLGEAQEAGDEAQVRLCERAMAEIDTGASREERPALQACWSAIRAAAAMQ